MNRLLPHLALAASASAILMITAGFAPAHDALPSAAQPQGWTYPVACCSGVDCREVADVAIVEGPNGYTIRATGETIAMTSRKVRPSPDGRFHWCSVKGLPDSATICLFVPPRGM